MIISFLLLELLLGAMLLGFIGAYKKRLFDRIILIATVPLAFIAAILVTKSAMSNAEITILLEERVITLIDGSPSAEFLQSICGALVGPVFAMLFFWIFLFLLRIITGIVLWIIHLCSGCRAREKEAKRAYKEAKREGRDAKDEDSEKSIFKRYKKPLWHKLTTGAVGAVSGFLIVMLSMLPVVYISNIAEPAVEKALAAENEGTYANEIAKTVDENFMVLSEKSAFGKIQKFTGMRAITNAAVNSLTKVDIKCEDGTAVEFNLSDVLSSLLESGVDAAVTYERVCASGATMSSLAPMSDIILSIAENDNIVNFCFIAYDNAKVFIFGEDSTKELPYDIESAEALRQDLTAAAGLVEIAASDLGDISFESEDFLNDILAYLEDEESAKKLVNTIGATSVYKTNFPKLMEYALGMIADQLDLPENKADDYAMFIADMTEALNNKAFGTYDESQVEYFIKYAAENGLNVSTYTVANKDEPTALDVAYLNYIEFIDRKNGIEAVFTGKLLDSAKKLSYYVTASGEIYVYSNTSSGWEIYSGGELNKSSYAALLLANEVNKLLIENPTEVIESGDVKDIAELAKNHIGSVELDTENNTVLMLDAVLNISNYSPDGAMYRESIVAAINHNAVIDKAHNDAFGTSLTIMAKLYGSLTEESSEASIDTIMDNFHLVGRVLDCLKAMETTSAVPDKMLDAIMQNKNYGQYFSSDAVQKVLENIKSGKSTYEELFTTVQGVWGLASGIIPS